MTKTIAVLGGFLLAVVIILKIWVNNTMVSYGEKLENINRAKINLRLENQLLETEIVTLSSLTKIATKSSELGFSNLNSIKYIR